MHSRSRLLPLAAGTLIVRGGVRIVRRLTRRHVCTGLVSFAGQTICGLVVEAAEDPGSMEQDERLAASARANLQIRDERVAGHRSPIRCLTGQLALVDGGR